MDKTLKKKAPGKKKATTKKKNKGGRPSKLQTIDYEQVELLAGFGLIDKQIAQILKINERTFHRYKKSTKFCQSIKKGKLKANLEVVKSLYKRAVGYIYDEVTKEPVIVVKQEKGEQKKYVMKEELIITKVVTKQVVPDTIAGIYWTKNRMKMKQGYEDDWRDRQEIEHSGEIKSDRSEVIAGLTALSDKKKQKILKTIREAIADTE